MTGCTIKMNECSVLYYYLHKKRTLPDKDRDKMFILPLYAWISKHQFQFLVMDYLNLLNKWWDFILVDIQQKDVEPAEKDNINKAAALYKFLGIKVYPNARD